MTMNEYNKLKNNDMVYVTLDMFTRPIMGIVTQRMTPFGVNGFTVVINKPSLQIIFAPEDINTFVEKVHMDMPNVVDAKFKSVEE